MAPKTLCVRARGDALLQDYEAMDARVKRFVGRKLVEVEPSKWGFVPTGESVSVPFRGEYVRAVQEGDLWAADAATAAACGVDFDPKFGAPGKADASAEKKG